MTKRIVDLGPLHDVLLANGVCCATLLQYFCRNTSAAILLLRYYGSTATQLVSQLFGTFTYERSNSATDAHPSSRKVRSRSVRKISMARSTPASPPAANP